MDVLMPKVGLTMTEGSIVQWHRREGELVRKGDLLFTFETEKSTLEFESPVEGVLAQILVPPGQVTACLAPVARMSRPAQTASGHGTEPAGEKAASAQDSKTPDAPSATQQPESPAVRRSVSPRARLRARELNVPLNDIAGSGPDGVVLERDVLDFARPSKAQSPKSRASPLAARVAAELGVDLAEVQASNPDGRITREDVERAAAEQRALSPTHLSDVQTLSAARRITAQRTAESARDAPHVTLTTEADATALVSAREQLNAELNEKVSYNALLIAIVARALKEHPQLNASWAGAGITMHPEINIGVAVDTPRGLYVPVVREATRALIDIHRALNDLVARTLAGQVSGDDIAGGTFTITNLGMYDIDAFTPIINPPEAGILGVGRILGKPVARGEQVVVRQMVALSLSFDHRVVDGAPAAKFLQRIKALVERPFALLI